MIRTLAVASVALATGDLTPLAFAQFDPGLTSEDGFAEPVRELWLHPRPVVRRDGGGAVADATCIAFLSTNEDPEGDMPRNLAITPDGATAVIVNRDTDALTFLDVDTQTITGTVTVGDFPVCVDVTPDGAYALTTDVFSNTVSVVDLGTRTLAASIPITGDQPFLVHVTADGSSAVVGVINDGISSSFSIIDLGSLTETDVIPSTGQGVIGGFFTPESGISGNIFTQFEVSPDSRTIVLPDRGNGRVGLYDIGAGAQVADIATNAGPTPVAVAGDGSIAVVSHEGAEKAISVIDLDAMVLDHVVPTGADLFNQVIALTPDNQFAMAAILNNLIFVDLLNDQVTATINTGTVGDIVVSADGQYAFVSNANARIISIATQSLVATIPFAPGAETVSSPVENRAIVLNNRFAEDANVYDINGNAGFAEGGALSGEPNEGDATRAVTISADGGTLVACNNTSRNVSIIDLDDATVRAYVDTGDRVWDSVITPDGSTALVTNTDANSITVIDLNTDTAVATLNTPQRPTEIVMSPDGTQAYAVSVAGSDQVWFIDVDGANTSVTGNIPAGQLGSIIYTYNVSSGIGLSPDGSILAVCVSFDDILKLVDATTQQVIANVAVGDFPIRVAFSPDGTLAYVTNSFSNDMSVVEIDGANSQTIATVPAIQFPLTVTVDGAGGFAYVGSFDFNSPSLKVVDLGTNAIVKSVSLGDAPRAVELDDARDTLYVATTGGDLVRVSAAGAASAVIDTEALSAGPSDLALHAPSQTAVAAQPIPDGVDILRYGPSADCDDNGDLNILDFVCFQQEWQAQSEKGDCDGNGLYNILDFVCFQGVFTQGGCS